MKFDLDYIKSLYVIYEEYDTEEEDAFYTEDYIVGDHFSDEQIINEFEYWDNIPDIIKSLVQDDIVGELKAIYIKDNTGKMLAEEEW